MQYDNETIAALALARMSHFYTSAMKTLYMKAGTFSAVADNRNNIRDIAADCPEKIVKDLNDYHKFEDRAVAELEYDAAHNVKVLILSDSEYPSRMRECDDAPLVLFHCGNASLNTKRMISIVGTRHATQYADDCIARLTRELHEMCPEIAIVSGLAYGVDIMAHRHSLDNDIPTFGVLAHGLDYLYPPRHRDTANMMVKNGGLITEFFTGTNADKVNFLRRNRIVAGMCDATVIVESAARGGGLATCNMALSYNREVFAFPGRATDKYSEGCNNLIRDNKASLITSAKDLVERLDWTDDAKLKKAKETGIERTLFPNLSPQAQSIVDALTADNDLTIDTLTSRTGLQAGSITQFLFELEMGGLIKSLAGNRFHLIK